MRIKFERFNYFIHVLFLYIYTQHLFPVCFKKRYEQLRRNRSTDLLVRQILFLPKPIPYATGMSNLDFEYMILLHIYKHKVHFIDFSILVYESA